VKKPKVVKLYEKGISNADAVKIALENALEKHEEIKADRCIVILVPDDSDFFFSVHGGDIDEREALWMAVEYSKKLLEGEIAFTGEE